MLLKVLALSMWFATSPLVAQEDRSEVMIDTVIRIFQQVQAAQKDPTQGKILMSELFQSIDYEDATRKTMSMDWNQLTPIQRKRVSWLIRFYIENAVMPTIDKISIRKIHIQRVKSRGDYYLVVSSVEDSFGERMGVAWQMKYYQSRPRVLDIAVGGISTFGSIYSEMRYIFLQNNSDVDSFLDYMESGVGK